MSPVTATACCSTSVVHCIVPVPVLTVQTNDYYMQQLMMDTFNNGLFRIPNRNSRTINQWARYSIEACRIRLVVLQNMRAKCVGSSKGNPLNNPARLFAVNSLLLANKKQIAAVAVWWSSLPSNLCTLSICCGLLDYLWRHGTERILLVLGFSLCFR